ncbi:MAG: YbgC/FadM family acyl-CoA thioesterase [Epsilonproteobacteria bacterium]|nr:YbgC/FadM family acyl-CoA thioesterase [Campylobacterota bacterium]
MLIRVYYEDTDCGGIVYHSNYLNFCERARSELFFQKGLSPHEENKFFVVKHMECDFLTSSKFGDILNVSTQVIEIKKASIKLEQLITRDKENIFKTIVTLVFLKDGKPSRIPQEKLAIFS